MARQLPMYELGNKPNARQDSIVTRELAPVDLPVPVRSGKTPPGAKVVRSAAVATHIVRKRKTTPPSRLVAAPRTLTPLPSMAMTPPAPHAYDVLHTPSLVQVRRRGGLEFGPGGKAILILAALSVVAVIISTILTSL